MYERFKIHFFFLQKDAVSRQDSIIPAPPASAFGDDEEDYRRVTNQQASDEKKSASGNKDEAVSFGTATFSKAPKGIEELVSISHVIWSHDWFKQNFMIAFEIVSVN